MPQLLDQHYWAHRVRRVGIGPPAVPRYAADPDLLARAIRTSVDGAALRERARAFGAAMHTNGATEAAELLERACSARP